MGRKAGEVAAYYWLSKETGMRVGWVFPSRKEADKWRNNKCYKYVENRSLTHYLFTVPLSRHTKEKEIWTRHKETYDNLVLKRAKIVYL